MRFARSSSYVTRSIIAHPDPARSSCFGATPLVCGLAPSIEALVAGRVGQGVFGALLTPSALAVIVTAFPPQRRGAAVGSWTAWSRIATVVGPLVGGQLIDGASWRWIFAINLPFVAITLLLIAAAVPRRARATNRPRLDRPGGGLSFLALAGPTLALIRQPASGWGAPDVILPGLAGVLLLIVFVAREARTADPLFHAGMLISAALVALGGLLELALIRNPRRAVACAGCAGGQLVGAPADAARQRALPAAR